MREKTKYNPENIFLILGAFFIGISIFAFPLNRIPDETNHARMAWQIVYTRTNNSFDWMNSIENIDKVSFPEYKNLFTEKINLANDQVENNFSIKNIPHIPQLLGMLLGKSIYPSVGVIMTMGRITNALFYLISLFFIIKKLKFGKFPLAFISLLPISIQQASSLSYDVVNFVFVSFVFFLISNLVINRNLNYKNIMGIIIAFIGCYVTKMNNFFLLLLFPLLKIHFSDKFKKANNFLNQVYQLIARFKYFVLFISVFFISIVAVFYFKDKGGITHFIQVMINSVLNTNLNGHINGILSLGIFGFLGQFQVQMPLWIIYIDIVVLVLLMFQLDLVDVDIETNFGIASALMFPLQVLVIIGGMYFAWTPLVLGDNASISVGAQGRYFTPFLIFFSPFFLSIKNSVALVFQKNTVKKIVIITLIVNFLIMTYLIVFYYWIPDYETDWLIRIRELLN
ncbi:DUF2142 domain-containing protein [Enterococcus nangangensis]|uniref:DUF2142 domain-containing protein n=1 Tax=Enterococcus nangangensis TaxID=2559926 RepID=UPI0010F84729|nr:DUF2142 domain-containing protein [Enterococcus nangangensis]